MLNHQNKDKVNNILRYSKCNCNFNLQILDQFVNLQQIFVIDCEINGKTINKNIKGIVFLCCIIGKCEINEETQVEFDQFYNEKQNYFQNQKLLEIEDIIGILSSFRVEQLEVNDIYNAIANFCSRQSISKEELQNKISQFDSNVKSRIMNAFEEWK